MADTEKFDAVADCVALAEVVTVPDGVPDTESVPLTVSEPVGEPDGESDVVADAVDVPFAAAPDDAVAGALAVAQVDTELVPEPVPETEGDGVAVPDTHDVAVIVNEAVPETDSVPVPDCDGLPE